MTTTAHPVDRQQSVSGAAQRLTMARNNHHVTSPRRNPALAAQLDAAMARANGARYAASLLDRHSGASIAEAEEIALTAGPEWFAGFTATAELILGDLI